MSYCRWSSENGSSDVYVYEDICGGWTTHVAGMRRAFHPIPEIPVAWLPDLGGKWDQSKRAMSYPTRWHELAAIVVFGIWGFWHRRIHMGMVNLIPLRPIGLPHDGKSFNDETPGECAARLLALRSAGYVVPQRAIDALLAEQADGVVGEEGRA